VFSAHSILQPSGIFVPFPEILGRWTAADFDRRACKEALARLIEERRLPPDLFSLEEIDRGGMAATPALLFDIHARPRDWTWWFLGVPGQKEFACEVAAECAADTAEVLRAAAKVDRIEALAEILDLENLSPWMSEAFRAAYQDDAPFGFWRVPRAPGLYRREHASLVIRSSTTTILTDPQGLTLTWTTDHGRYPAHREAFSPDAIALTHGHEDHWSLASALAAAGSRETPILVPRVPKVNLLCPEDFSASLAAVGQRALAPGWGCTTKVGDIEIEVLPFYGEQPTRNAPGCDPALRNWGNCYRFDCPEFSALILVDSGVDPAGSAIEAISRSAAKRGPIDIVLSCCHAFPEGINVGLAPYALALPFSRLEEIHRESKKGHREMMTLGPSGVAEACRVAGARYFLPYAHGFGGLGRDPVSTKSGITEKALLADVTKALKAQGGATTILSWKPGDAALLSGRDLQIDPAQVDDLR
jgi:L-ascorbate metabolism protein UlaG (beta-lactamase superfamily)